ncbi:MULTISPECIES: hypothetical protein [unclassified Streptomyces]|uniref:hypothetical protein n=1 Tax=unclassified Streptomyces TaxID=2593676 RepID=UPI002365D66C|nr:MULTISPECIES: hypothetical protein [unclassified Streptomyces]MDF3144509.1 hypothetical protein [Streptomyces sp. T21Q-yed]WDF38930.1 hypothetical protein PBV52_20055 [Streptomyces sp. T12]
MTARTPDRTAPIEGVALLVIPRLGTLSERQVRGITCVWDAALLTPCNAVSLGPCRASRAGERVTWYPRGCRSCVAVAALMQLTIHARACPTCQREDGDPCDT